VPANDCLPSDDVLSEHAYLVARSVRPLAIAGNCAAEPELMTAAMSRLTRAGCESAVPFVLDEGDGIATYGYASHAWAVDLLRWTLASAPPEQVHRIIGLLLGYSADSVERHEALDCGRPFTDRNPAISSPPRGASRQRARSAGMAGTRARKAS
jgi:hypothetical protein